MWVTVWTLSVAFWYKSPKQSIKTKKIRARSIYLINSLPLSFATLLYQYEILVLDIYWQNHLCLDSFQHTHTPTKIQTLISIFNFLSLQGVLEVYGSVSWGQDYFGHGCNWVFSKEYCNNSYPIPLFLSFPLITAWMIISSLAILINAIFMEKMLRVQPNVKKIYLLSRAPGAKSASQRLQNEVYIIIIPVREKQASN